MENNAITTTPSNGFSLSLNPSTPEQTLKLCETLANSKLIPNQFQGKPQDIFIAGMMGTQLKLDVFASMRGIAVINGRPALWGDVMVGICQRHPEFAGTDVRWAGGTEDQPTICEYTVWRNHRGSKCAYHGTFSIEDAKIAGLLNKAGPWTQYPRRMLENRARAFALRNAFADALQGFESSDEVMDLEPREVEHNVVPDPVAPKRRRIKEEAEPTKQEPVEQDATESFSHTDAPAAFNPRSREEFVRIGFDLYKRHGKPVAGKVSEILGRFGIAKMALIKDEDLAAGWDMLDQIIAEFDGVKP